MKNKPTCMICNEVFSVSNEFDVKTHFDTKRAYTFDKLKDQFREDKVSEVNSILSGQKSFSRI